VTIIDPSTDAIVASENKARSVSFYLLYQSYISGTVVDNYFQMRIARDISRRPWTRYSDDKLR
jgi:hypothetical protein